MDVLEKINDNTYRDRAGKDYMVVSKNPGPGQADGGTMGVPVVPLIAGGVKLIAGLVSNSRQKLLALREQSGQLDSVLAQLKRENQQLDAEIARLKREIARLRNGLAGIFQNWFGKKKRERLKIASLQKQIEAEKAKQAQKIAELRSLQDEYARLVAQQQQQQSAATQVATAGFNWLPAILIGSAVVGGAVYAKRKKKKAN